MKAQDVIARLAGQSRVIVLGGIAVVLHGLSRSTKDIDIWLDPLDNEQLWANSLNDFLSTEGLTASRVGDGIENFIPIRPDELANVVASERFVRALGTDRPVDIFRIPNHLTTKEFNEIWERSQRLPDGTRMLDEIDLIVTKMETGRPHDESDIRFLQNKVERIYRQRLKTCSLKEGTEMLERLPTPNLVAFAATEAEDRAVRNMGMQILEDLCMVGDPYALQLAGDIKRKIEQERGGDGRGSR